MKKLKVCEQGHEYYKSSDCPVCPVCEELRKPEEGFLAKLSAPARRPLEAAGVVTLTQLSKWSEAELRQLHGFGPGSLPKLRDELSRLGLSFRNEVAVANKKKEDRIHTTNYRDTLVEVAEDCPVQKAEMPPLKGDKRTIANLQFEMLYEHPYKYSSDDVIFSVHAERSGIRKADLPAARKEFFSKGQACMRTSPLTKRYGWGVHNNAEGKIAIYARESPEYQRMLKDKKLDKVKAMKSKR